MKAMILAAGFGTRLNDLTKNTPKCLMQAGGRTMLEHAVDSVVRAGVDSIVINTHYLANQVEQFVETRGQFGMTVHLSYEPVLLGTGGGLRNVRNFFAGEDDFLVVNADVYCDLNLRDVIDARRSAGALGALVVMERKESSYLLFESSSRLLMGWERASQGSGNSSGAVPIRKAFCGIQVLSQKIFDYMKTPEQSFSIIDSYMEAVGAGERILPFELSHEFWIDIGTPQQLQLLQQRLA